MNNNVITTSPQVTGNIGSCETKTAKEQVGNTWFTETYETIFTNSCTGEVIQTAQYTAYDGVLGTILGSLFVLFVGFGVIYAIVTEDSEY